MMHPKPPNHSASQYTQRICDVYVACCVCVCPCGTSLSFFVSRKKSLFQIQWVVVYVVAKPRHAKDGAVVVFVGTEWHRSAICMPRQLNPSNKSSCPFFQCSNHRPHHRPLPLADYRTDVCARHYRAFSDWDDSESHSHADCTADPQAHTYTDQHTDQYAHDQYADTRADTRPNVRPAFRPASRPNVRPAFRPDFRPASQPDFRPDFRPD